MKNIKGIFVALLMTATVVSAQTLYFVEPGTKLNTITLEVTNKSGRPLNDLQLAVEKLPSWIKIADQRIGKQRVGMDSTVNVTISFDVATSGKAGKASPQAGEKENISIVLSSGFTRLMQKNILVTIASPQTYELNQNYPNPFNPTTTIKYQLPIASRVSLKVFDVLGREVTTLVNEEQAAGYFETRFDASNVASGVYFYRLEGKATDGSGSFRQVRRLMLIK